ncbi:hypothetical protein FKM82_018466, partial [Ascaphus truei]
VSKQNKRIVYTILEYSPLLDSCNMTTDDWAKIAKDIQKHYVQYDGFVILHGTDTMAYTASALSFMCENLGKTIVLTGSQVSESNHHFFIFTTVCERCRSYPLWLTWK